ncbi:hypothetical protein V1509DRAFT_573035, partial [Lipomyces kononenkoae]
MSSVYQCAECKHAPFNTRDKLNRHVSVSHSKPGFFSFEGVAYPLIMTPDGKYACPTCTAESSNVSNLRRHMARVDCARGEDNTGVDQVENCQTPVRFDGFDDQVESCESHGRVDEDNCASLGGIGLSFNREWNVITCDQCHHIVDKAMVEDHLTNVHKLVIEDKSAMWCTIRAYRLRPHLAVVWDDGTEQQLDDSDDEYAGRTGFEPGAFRPGAAAVEGVSVVDGFKCVLCESDLQHRCVQSKEAMRTHYKRNHANQVVEFQPVRVQAFYGRS